MLKGRRGGYSTEFYLGQRPYMINLITKKLKINCSKCTGRGHDNHMQPCTNCDGCGWNMLNVSLFELIGMAQVVGAAYEKDKPTVYNMRYYDLLYLKEDERAMASKRAWKSYDDGIDSLSVTREVALDVTESQLFVTFNVAIETAHDLNIDLLGAMKHDAKIELINQFNDTTGCANGRETPIVDSIIDDYDLSSIGEYPALSYLQGNQAPTVDEFKKALADVDIDTALI